MSEDVVVVDDAARFRQILGSFPTGVTIVTSLEEGRPVGMAAGSFFSVSLDPPLVGFCVMTTSNTWPVIERSGSFGVSILADDQTDICRRLASKAPDKLDCDLEQQHLAGDHWIVVGRVRALDFHRAEADPLVFCRGGFGRQTPI